jgi:hypothetical protein
MLMKQNAAPCHDRGSNLVISCTHLIAHHKKVN